MNSKPSEIADSQTLHQRVQVDRFVLLGANEAAYIYIRITTVDNLVRSLQRSRTAEKDVEIVLTSHYRYRYDLA